MASQNPKDWVPGKNPNLWVSLFLMVISALVINESFELELGNPNNPGSGFMFFGAASVLGLLALQQFIKSLRFNRSSSKEGSEKIHWGRILIVMAANVLYIYLLQPVGYLLCTFLLLFFLFQVLERGRWVQRMIGSALTSLFTYLLFARLLQLNLPKGVIPFL